MAGTEYLYCDRQEGELCFCDVQLQLEESHGSMLLEEGFDAAEMKLQSHPWQWGGPETKMAGRCRLGRMRNLALGRGESSQTSGSENDVPQHIEPGNPIIVATTGHCMITKLVHLDGRADGAGLTGFQNGQTKTEGRL